MDLLALVVEYVYLKIEFVFTANEFYVTNELSLIYTTGKTIIISSRRHAAT